MTLETAEFWLDNIAAGGVCLWMIGVWFVLQARKVSGQLIEGEFEVAASQETISQGFAEVLSRSQSGLPLGDSVLDSVTPSEVRWHSTRMCRAGVIHIKGRGGKSLVTYQVEVRNGMLKAAYVVVVIGAVAIGVLYTMLSKYALPSDIPNIRGQVFQMAQCIHLLWPPFLIGGLARLRRTMMSREIERTLKNVPFQASFGT